MSDAGIPCPLTDEEVRELDSFGYITGRTSLSLRALKLWEREILWGRVTQEPLPFDGLRRDRNG